LYKNLFLDAGRDIFLRVILVCKIYDIAGKKSRPNNIDPMTVTLQKNTA